MSSAIGRDQLVALARGSLCPTDIGAHHERSIIETCRADVDRRVRKVEARVLRGARRAARREADDLRASLAGRTLALWSSLPRYMKDNRTCPVSERGAFRTDRWNVVRLGLNDVSNLDQPATASVYAKLKTPPGTPKGGRRYRPIFKFDWIDMARQRLVLSGLSPFVDFHPSQYLLRQAPAGRGRTAVCESLRRELPLLGRNAVFVQLDVRSFHASISHSWLETNLPLPKGAIRSCVHTGGMTIVPLRKNVRACLGRAYSDLDRRGIPSGSALSSLVGEYVIAEVLRGLADRPEGRLLHAYSHNFHTYSDNLGVFVERERAAAVVDLLQEAFASCPAGPFELRAAAPKPITEPFAFLGYWFRLAGGAVEVFVPEHIAQRRLDAIMQDLHTAGPRELKLIRNRIAGIVSDWQYWDGVAKWERDALYLVSRAEEALPAFERQRLQALAA